MAMSVALSLNEQKKKKNKFWTIVFIIFLLLLVFLCSAFFVYINSNKNAISKDAKNSVQSLSSQLNNQIDYDLNILNVLANLVLDNPDLATLENVNALLSNEKSENTFQKISYLYNNASGYTYDYPTQTMSSVDLSTNQCFSESINNSYCLNFDIASGVEDVSVPVKNSKDEIIGVILGSKSMENLKEIINNLKSNFKSDTYLVDSDGVVLYQKTSENEISTIVELPYFKSNISEESLFNNVSNLNTKWLSNKSLNDTFITVSKLAYGDYRLVVIFSDLTASKKFEVPHLSLKMSSIKYIFYGLASLVALFLLCFIVLKLYSLISKKSTKTVMKWAMYDEVTGGYNKSKFFLEVSSTLLNAKDDDKYSMILMDIENFKVINQLYDATKGNEVLKDIADTVKWFLEKDGISARMMSDYFAILFKSKRDEKIISFVNNVTRAIGEYKLNVKLMPRFGIYNIQDFSVPVETMIDRALMAKKLVTADSELNYAFFTKELIEEIEKSKDIENEMYYALNQNQFVIYLQPQIDVLTKDTVGAEALVRWNHPEKGLMLPNKFLNVFEKNSFIMYLDQYVIEQVCKLISKWINYSVEPIPVSVNLSSLDLSNPRFADMMNSMADMYKVPTKFINFEINEDIVFENKKYIKRTIADLKKYGFSVSLDNFGKGYSAVNLLNEFTFDNVKFNMNFIKTLILSDRGRNILKDMKTLINSVYAKAVAMGIETDTELDYMKMMEFDYMQGFIHARPMCIVDFEAFVFKKTIGNDEDICND